MAEVKYDKNHAAGANAEERIRNRYRNSGSLSYTDHEPIRQGTSPLRHVTNISETAHMHSEPYTSLLNAGLSRSVYNGEKGKR